MTMQGSCGPVDIPGRKVRTATEADMAACDALCMRVHGHRRTSEVRYSLEQGTALVVEKDGRFDRLRHFGRFLRACRGRVE